MKKVLVLGMLLVSILGFSQETEFKFSKDGFTDFVVIPIEGKTQAELYKKTLDWIQVTYNTPREVIKGQIENDYIRIEGSKPSMLCTKVLGMTTCNDTRYQIEISVKNGKYKFDVIRLEQYVKSSQYVVGGWHDVTVSDTKALYKDSGEIRSMFKLYPEAMETTFNSLNNSLKTFLMNETTPIKSNNW